MILCSMAPTKADPIVTYVQGRIQVELDVGHLISVSPRSTWILDARDFPESDFSMIFDNL